MHTDIHTHVQARTNMQHRTRSVSFICTQCILTGQHNRHHTSEHKCACGLSMVYYAVCTFASFVAAVVFVARSVASVRAIAMRFRRILISSRICAPHTCACTIDMNSLTVRRNIHQHTSVLHPARRVPVRARPRIDTHQV